MAEPRGTWHTLELPGGSESCRNIWQVGRILVSLSRTALLQPGSAALSLGALLRAVPDIVAPMAESQVSPCLL